MSTSGDSVIRRFEDNGDRYPGFLYVLCEFPEAGWDAKPIPEAFGALGIPLDVFHRSIEEARKTEPDPLPEEFQYDFQKEPNTVRIWRDSPGARVVPEIASVEWLRRPVGRSWDLLDCMNRFDVLTFDACREFAADQTLTDLVAALGTSTKAWLRTVHRLANPRRKWWEWLGDASWKVPASGVITRPVFSVIPDVFDVSARIARHLIEQRSEPDKNAHDAVIDDLITLAQVAPLTGLSKRTLERYRLPKPDEQGGGGRARKWYYKRLRSALEKRSKRPLPKTFPGSQFRSSRGA